MKITFLQRKSQSNSCISLRLYKGIWSSHISRQLKQWTLRLLISFFDFLIWATKAIKVLCIKLFSSPIRHLGRFFLFSFTKCYKVIRPYKQILSEIISPHHNIFRSLFTNKYVMHILVISTTVLITFQNIFAYDNVRSENFGQNTLLYGLASSDEFSEIVEETAIEDKELLQTHTPSRYMEENAVSAFPVSEAQTELAYEVPALQTTGAVVKPDIIDTKNVEKRDSVISYTIQSGDTLSTIAQKFNISTSTIIWENNLSYYSTIRPGDTLRILPVSGIAHNVKSGETLQAIANKYDADLDKIVDFNKLTDASDIASGQALIIPEGKKVLATTTATPKATTAVSVTQTKPETLASSSQISSGLIWPTNSTRITQYFSLRHTGIDIGGGGVNRPLYAVDNATVSFVGWRNGYGNTVEVQLGNGYMVRYAHLYKIYVNKGQKLQKGEVIGLMGTTGWSTGIHLHIEFLKNGVRLNPLNFLN